MEHYKEEPTISQQAEEDPFNLSATVPSIHVGGKGSTREYVSQCLRLLAPPPSSQPPTPNPNEAPPARPPPPPLAVCLVAQGKHIHKAVTTAEILKAKKTNQEIHQLTHVSSINITETYSPVEEMEEELEPIRVTRTIPIIHLLLVTPPIDSLPHDLQHLLSQQRPSQLNQPQGYQKTQGDGRKYSKKPLPTSYFL